MAIFSGGEQYDYIFHPHVRLKYVIYDFMNVW